MTTQPIKGCLDAQATVAYELDYVFRKYDPRIARYLNDLGRSYQSNDAVAKLQALRKVEHRLKNIYSPGSDASWVVGRELGLE